MSIERDIGQLQGAQAAMQRDMDSVKADIAQLRKDMTHLVSLADQAKGGWKVMLAVGAISATLTAGLMKLVSALLARGG